MGGGEYFLDWCRFRPLGLNRPTGCAPLYPQIPDLVWDPSLSAGGMPGGEAQAWVPAYAGTAGNLGRARFGHTIVFARTRLFRLRLKARCACTVHSCLFS